MIENHRRPKQQKHVQMHMYRTNPKDTFVCFATLSFTARPIFRQIPEDRACRETLSCKTHKVFSEFVESSLDSNELSTVSQRRTTALCTEQRQNSILVLCPDKRSHEIDRKANCIRKTKNTLWAHMSPHVLVEKIGNIFMNKHEKQPENFHQTASIKSFSEQKKVFLKFQEQTGRPQLLKKCFAPDF